MAKKKKKLVDGFEAIIESGDLDAFKAVFDKCEITASKYGGKDKCNAMSYKNLTPEHIRFLIDNGLDVNSDCGFGYPAIAFQAYDKENLKCLLENGADINCVVESYRGTALTKACEELDPVAVKNLLEAGASVDVPGFIGETLLNTVLRRGDNIYIPQVLEISRMLLDAGCTPDDKSREYVTKTGERFEFFRDRIAPDFLDEPDAALSELYVLFDVPPVPKRKQHDGISEIKVEGKVWTEQYNELWQLLVPSGGKAQTLQGEAIRIAGKVTYEILDNGGINWDEEYRKMAAFLADILKTNPDAIGKEKFDEAILLISKISANSDKKLLYRLTELVVEWVLANPKPVPLGEVDYIR